jgi:TRAP-type C4-dicarboxylate transport system permease small subunit
MLALAGCMSVYILAILLSTWGGVEQVHPTWNRLILQLSVPLVLLVALALRQALRSLPRRRRSVVSASD